MQGKVFNLPKQKENLMNNKEEEERWNSHTEHKLFLMELTLAQVVTSFIYKRQLMKVDFETPFVHSFRRNMDLESSMKFLSMENTCELCKEVDNCEDSSN